MASQGAETELVDKCAAYLRATYGEELLEHDILENDVADGDGTLAMNCTVRTGSGKSRWQKTFTFRGGKVANMTWRYLG